MNTHNHLLGIWESVALGHEESGGGFETKGMENAFWNITIEHANESHGFQSHTDKLARPPLHARAPEVSGPSRQTTPPL
jgi:hypothetical protein